MITWGVPLLCQQWCASIGETAMRRIEATADVFRTALKALPRKERDAVLVRIAHDKSLARDLLDLAVIAQRRREPSRPFAQYLADRKKRAKRR